LKSWKQLGTSLETQIRFEREAARMAETTWRSTEVAEEAAATRTAEETSTHSSRRRHPNNARDSTRAEVQRSSPLSH